MLTLHRSGDGAFDRKTIESAQTLLLYRLIAPTLEPRVQDAASRYSKLRIWELLINNDLYKHSQGRDDRLTDVHGEVVGKILVREPLGDRSAPFS